MNEILLHALVNRKRLSWEALIDKTPFSQPCPIKPPPPIEPPEENTQGKHDQAWQVTRDWVLQQVERSMQIYRDNKLPQHFEEMRNWQRARDDLFYFEQNRLNEHSWQQTRDWVRRQAEICKRRYEEIELPRYRESLTNWQQTRDEFLRRQQAANAAIESLKTDYESGKPLAVERYCEHVLRISRYPDTFPHKFEVHFKSDTGVLLVNYALPDRMQLSNSMAPGDAKPREAISQYESVLYQIVLRSIFEIFSADSRGTIAAVVFNGFVQTIDKATGLQINPCILSLHVGRNEFLSLNLALVDPEACFKKLKGVRSSALHTMTPIAPIMQMNRADSRFVASRNVADGVESGDNLAVMDWEDFEHLVREIFSKEFDGRGEVRTTRASRDGGVDAIVFDADPIRGGKIVIQAKRYTNTVGVSAVRDLYGTLINEGAMKGILVTTSDYGPDAYEFAKDKPLTLLNGGHLLHLLQKHGFTARIDLEEAKKLLSKESRQG
jgi:restriction system protein